MASEWQPIATAPKDCRLVIVGWTGSTLVIPAYFHQLKDGFDPRADYQKTGWYGWNEIWDSSFQLHEPTHWQPMPKSPGESDADDEPTDSDPTDIYQENGGEQ